MRSLTQYQEDSADFVCRFQICQASCDSGGHRLCILGNLLLVSKKRLNLAVLDFSAGHLPELLSFFLPFFFHIITARTLLPFKHCMHYICLSFAFHEHNLNTPALSLTPCAWFYIFCVCGVQCAKCFVQIYLKHFEKSIFHSAGNALPMTGDIACGSFLVPLHNWAVTYLCQTHGCLATLTDDITVGRFKVLSKASLACFPSLSGAKIDASQPTASSPAAACPRSYREVNKLKTKQATKCNKGEQGVNRAQRGCL